MISFFDFFSSINKIALFAFVVVSGILFYEIKKMLNENKKKERPHVPKLDLNGATKPVMQTYTPLPKNAVVAQNRGRNVFVLVLGILTLLILFVYIAVTIRTQLQRQKTAPIPIVTEIASAGLKLYDTKWTEIVNYNTNTLAPGKTIYIAIQTIIEADIDRARIHVNSNAWTIQDITTSYNPALKVYYKEYTVATGTATLKIDAQLHSASDGWLGE